MTLYEKLDIPSYWNKPVEIKAKDRTVYHGVMYDIVNDEDEPEAIAIQIGALLEEILLSAVESIEETDAT